MAKILKFIGLASLFFLLNYFLIWYFYLSKNIVVKEGEMLIQDINLNTGSITLEKNSVLKGDIKINNGLIELKEGAKILGEIDMKEGEILSGKNTEFAERINLVDGKAIFDEGSLLKDNIDIGNGQIEFAKKTLLEKDLNIESGFLRINENVEIKGSINTSENTQIEKHSSSIILGKKPPVYKVYDWPEALQYLDILPETHKNQVGFIILTKEKNGLIRGENIKTGGQYFEGIYDYKDGKLIKVDLSNTELMNNFFKTAKIFFDSLPEYRMVYFNVGAATENYANNPEFADIYLPSENSGTLILHEMAHVMDFKSDFSDFHVPKFPWTKEDAVSGYGSTHPGEDFAEAYRMYALNKNNFLRLIKENPERQKKWDYLEEYVFN